MAIKYYSDELNKLFNTEEELIAEEEKAIAIKKEAEEKKANLKANREKRAKEVEDAFKTASDATNKAHELLEAFIRDYGQFHATFREPVIKDLWNTFFDLF